MDLEECRLFIDESDETIADNLIQRSEYPLGSGFLPETPDKPRYNSILKCVCQPGKLPEEDVSNVWKIDRGLESSMNARLGMAKKVKSYKDRNGLQIEDLRREKHVIDHIAAYVASKGKEPDPYKKAFRLIIEWTKELEKHYTSI